MARKLKVRQSQIYIPYRFFTSSKPKPVDKIVLELFYSENEDPVECGICLSDNIKICRMVSLNCGHSVCDNCLDGILDKSCNTCCPFCREEISEVETNCGESFGLLKENAIFITDFVYE